MVRLAGKAPTPSVLYLNRSHGEEIDVGVVPVDLKQAWARGRGGAYGLMEEVLERFGARYESDPRVLAVGPAAESTDFGAIGSAPVVKGRLTHADTWAGRGGMGSRMLQDHGVAAVTYGGTLLDEDFRDRTVADSWFQERYEKALGASRLPRWDVAGFDVVVDSMLDAQLGVNLIEAILSRRERPAASAPSG